MYVSPIRLYVDVTVDHNGDWSGLTIVIRPLFEVINRLHQLSQDRPTTCTFPPETDTDDPEGTGKVGHLLTPWCYRTNEGKPEMKEQGVTYQGITDNVYGLMDRHVLYDLTS